MKLGQHFLKNKKQIRKIVDALDLQSGDFVIELGPGHGELTKELGIRDQELGELKIVAIEKDEKLAELLAVQFGLSSPQKRGSRGVDGGVTVIEGDMLKELPKLTYKLTPNSYKLIGNIPYYLTGYLLRTIGELENKPSLIVFTIQKEVAERLVAQPPKMNLLAASVQYWAEPKIIGRIPAKDFKPAPKVDSAIIRLEIAAPRRSGARNDGTKVIARSGTTKQSLEAISYYKFIKILFSHPRKTILNNLSGLKDKEELKKILKKQGIKESARPQNLSVEKILSLSAEIS